MPSRKIRRAILFVFLVALAANLCWSLFTLLPQEQSARLPDGSMLTLRGWAYGKQHILMGRSGVWWQLFLPVKQIENYDTEKDTLVLWLTSSASHPVNAFGPQNMNHWWDWVEVLDEQGHRVVSTNPNQQPPYLLLSNNNVQDDFSQTDANRQSLTIHSFPRRGKKVILRFYAANRPQPVAVFTIPNPAPGPYPPASAVSLPSEAQASGLKCTLKAITLPDQYAFIGNGGAITSQMLPRNGLKLLPGESIAQRAVFRLEENGRENQGWLPASVALSDGTGNSYDVRIWSQGPGASLTYLAPFCASEPMQMKLHFVRSPAANIPLAEQWHLPALPLPKPGLITRSAATRTASGITFRLLGIAGPGTIQWEPSRKDTLYSNLYSVRVRISPQDQGYSLFVKGMDEQGRVVTGSGPSSYGPSSGWQECAEGREAAVGRVISLYTLSANSRSYSYTDTPGVHEETFFFQPRPGAKSLRLTFAINRSYEFHFTAPPSSENLSETRWLSASQSGGTVAPK